MASYIILSSDLLFSRRASLIHVRIFKFQIANFILLLNSLPRLSLYLLAVLNMYFCILLNISNTIIPYCLQNFIVLLLIFMRQCYLFGQIVFFSIEDYNTNFKAQLIFKKCRVTKIVLLFSSLSSKYRRY